MQNQEKMDSKQWARSIMFVTGFWSLIALFMVGMHHLLNAIDLIALIRSLFGA